VRAAIIGLGNVGMLYDLKQPTILTHAKALKELKEDFVGVDENPKYRKLFEKIYKKPAFSSISGLTGKFDIITIATPPCCHHENALEALQLTPKVLLVEKPFCMEMSQGEEILKAAGRKTKVLVNYVRRFDPYSYTIRDAFLPKIGKVNKIIVYYTHGIENTASHFIDLIHFLFPKETKEFRIHGVSGEDFQLRFCGFDVFFFCLPSNYVHREMIIYGDKGSIEYKNSGGYITLNTQMDNKLFPHQIILEPRDMAVSELNKIQLKVYDKIRKDLTCENIEATGKEALKTRTILDLLSLSTTQSEKKNLKPRRK